MSEVTNAKARRNWQEKKETWVERQCRGTGKKGLELHLRERALKRSRLWLDRVYFHLKVILSLESLSHMTRFGEAFGKFKI